jgi:esterase/lipase superfamily enzyme
MTSRKPAIMVRIGVFILVSLVTAGCAGPSLAPAPNLYWATGENPFGDVPQDLQTTAAQVLYATDRKPEGEKDGILQYGYHRSQSVAVGIATIQMGENLTWEQLVEASTQKEHPHKVPLALTGVEELVRMPPSNTPMEVVNGEPVENPDYLKAVAEAEAQITEIVRAQMAKSPVKDAFVFVHGYNNTFEDAAFRMATLWHYMGRPGVAILYSWPAGHPGLLRGYTYDRESSEFTVHHLKQIASILARCPEVHRIHVVGHSRGTDVVMNTLREAWIATRMMTDRRASKLGNVVIAAADIDWDVLQQRIAAERVFAGIDNIAFYLSDEDKALGISHWLFGSVARIGQLGMNMLTPEQRDMIVKQDQIQIIETKVKSDFIGHAYFIDNPAVLSDVILFLRDGKRPGAERGRPLSRRPGEFWTLTDDYLVKPPSEIAGAPAAASSIRPVGPG